MGFASLAKGYKAGGFNALQIGGATSTTKTCGTSKPASSRSLAGRAAAVQRLGLLLRLRQPPGDPPGHHHQHPALRRRHQRPEAWGMDFSARWQPTRALAWISTPPTSIPPTRTTVNAGRRRTSRPAHGRADVVVRGRRQLRPGPGRRTAASCVLACAMPIAAARVATTGSGEPGQLRALRRLHHRRGAEPHRPLCALEFAVRGHGAWPVYANNLFDNQYVTGVEQLRHHACSAPPALASASRAFYGHGAAIPVLTRARGKS